MADKSNTLTHPKKEEEVEEEVKAGKDGINLLVLTASETLLERCYLTDPAKVLTIIDEQLRKDIETYFYGTGHWTPPVVPDPAAMAVEGQETKELEEAKS